jgi:hypothetical protein
VYKTRESVEIRERQTAFVGHKAASLSGLVTELLGRAQEQEIFGSLFQTVTSPRKAIPRRRTVVHQRKPPNCSLADPLAQPWPILILWFALHVLL